MKTRYDYEGAISIQFSNVNNAWFGMWHDQVLEVFYGLNALEQAKHWAEQVTTPNVSLLKPARQERTRKNVERQQELIAEAIDVMSQDPGFIELRRKSETESKKAKLKAGGLRFRRGDQVRFVPWPGQEDQQDSRPWVGTVRSGVYEEHGIDGPGNYYEVDWWNPKLEQKHEDYLHQDNLRPADAPEGSGRLDGFDAGSSDALRPLDTSDAASGHRHDRIDRSRVTDPLFEVDGRLYRPRGIGDDDEALKDPEVQLEVGLEQGVAWGAMPGEPVFVMQVKGPYNPIAVQPYPYDGDAGRTNDAIYDGYYWISLSSLNRGAARVQQSNLDMWGLRLTEESRQAMLVWFDEHGVDGKFMGKDEAWLDSYESALSAAKYDLHKEDLELDGRTPRQAARESSRLVLDTHFWRTSSPGAIDGFISGLSQGISDEVDEDPPHEAVNNLFRKYGLYFQEERTGGADWSVRDAWKIRMALGWKVKRDGRQGAIYLIRDDDGEFAILWRNDVSDEDQEDDIDEIAVGSLQAMLEKLDQMVKESA